MEEVGKNYTASYEGASDRLARLREQTASSRSREALYEGVLRSLLPVSRDLVAK